MTFSGITFIPNYMPLFGRVRYWKGGTLRTWLRYKANEGKQANKRKNMLKQRNRLIAINHLYVTSNDFHSETFK
jgi:hypothetical protein